MPQPIAFSLMVATTIASGLLALRYASQAIAVLALLGGYVTPIAIATGARHSVIFLGYVAAFLALGALLLGVSYVYSRYRAEIGRIWKDEPSDPDPSPPTGWSR